MASAQPAPANFGLCAACTLGGEHRSLRRQAKFIARSFQKAKCSWDESTNKLLSGRRFCFLGFWAPILTIGPKEYIHFPQGLLNGLGHDRALITLRFKHSDMRYGQDDGN